MTCPEWANPEKHKVDQWWPGAGGRGQMGSDCSWVWGFFLRWWKCCGISWPRCPHNLVNTAEANELHLCEWHHLKKGKEKSRSLRIIPDLKLVWYRTARFLCRCYSIKEIPITQTAVLCGQLERDGIQAKETHKTQRFGFHKHAGSH